MRQPSRQVESLEQAGEEAGEELVAERVAAAIGLLDLRFPSADDHIELLVEQFADELGRGGGVVGRVAIGHQVDVGLDVGEHAPHDMALALHLLGANDRAGLRRDLAGAVTAVIVEDVDGGIGQRRPEAGDGLSDRGLLIVAGEEHGDAEVRQLRFGHWLIPHGSGRTP